MKRHTRFLYLDYVKDKQADLLALIAKTKCTGKLILLKKMLLNLMNEIDKKQS